MEADKREKEKETHCLIEQQPKVPLQVFSFSLISCSSFVVSGVAAVSENQSYITGNTAYCNRKDFSFHHDEL